MYRSYVHRTIQVIIPRHKLFASTSATKERLFEYYVDVIQKSFEQIGLLGPTGAEMIKDIDLANKTCLITGANSGIGLEMTRCLSNNDVTVLMACRNTYAADVATKNSGAKLNCLKLYELNLASLASVKKCSTEILKYESKLDIVILNAAVFGLPWTITEDALETTFQVNYLSHFYLLMNIEKILAPDARVVFISSESHRHVRWQGPQIIPTKEMLSLPESEYTSIKAYNISKLCGILLMHYLGYRWLNSGKSVFCAHPGSFIKTKLCCNWWPYELLYTTMKPFSKSIAQAAATPLYCATSPDLNDSTDQYYKNLERCEQSELACDFHLAFRIYDLTKEILLEGIAASEEVSALEKQKVDVSSDQAKVAIDENILVANYTG